MAVVTAALAQTPDHLQPRPTVLDLSLRKAVEIALSPEGSTPAQLADEAVKQAEARRGEARAALLPNVDGYFTGENFTRNLQAFGVTLVNVPGLHLNLPAVVGPLNNWDARATGTQSILDLSAITQYRASKVNTEAARSDRDGTRNQVTDQVARAYLNAIRADAAVESTHADVRLSEDLVRLAQSQKNAGTGTAIEITRQQVQLANDRQRLIQAQNQRDLAHLQLLRTLGLRLDTAFVLTDKLSFMPIPDVNEADAVAAAKKNRPDLRGQQQHEQVARLNYDAKKYERLPSLTAFADAGDIGLSLSDTLPTRTYGATLRIPIYNGGRRDAERAERASQLRQERIRTADLREQVELEVRQAIDSLHSAAAEVQAAEEGVKLAEDEVAHAERRYKAGVTNSIEVTDAQTRLTRAHDNRITALYDYNLARIELGTATGDVQSYIP
ncbi:MAG TPA: TolC family protein [Bryobacteraceae bacterium]|nr:TolC family protein [Bryobacteraceae bacterium]